MVSVELGTIDFCTLLLSKGSDPSIRANDGRGLIHFAALSGFERSIDFALAQEATSTTSITEATQLLWVALHSATLRRAAISSTLVPTHSSGHTAFAYANSEKMKSLLLKATEAFNPKKPIATPPPPAPEPTPTTTTTRTPPTNTGFSDRSPSSRRTRNPDGKRGLREL